MAITATEALALVKVLENETLAAAKAKVPAHLEHLYTRITAAARLGSTSIDQPYYSATEISLLIPELTQQGFTVYQKYPDTLSIHWGECRPAHGYAHTVLSVPGASTGTITTSITRV